MKFCEICNLEYVKNPLETNYLPDDIRLELEYMPDCGCELWDIKNAKLINKAEFIVSKTKGELSKYEKYSFFGEKFKKSTFEKASESPLIDTCKKYARATMEKPEQMSMVLYGGVGTGKTYASSCIANELIRNGKKVLMLPLNKYLSIIKQKWDEIESTLLELSENCDLLIIDDFGSEKGSEWVDEKLFNLIDTRYRSEKNLLITTNLIYDNDKSLCEFNKKLDPKNRIRDRLVEMAFFYLVIGKNKGESERKPKTTDDFKEFLKPL